MKKQDSFESNLGPTAKNFSRGSLKKAPLPSRVEPEFIDTALGSALLTGVNFERCLSPGLSGPQLSSLDRKRIQIGALGLAPT